MKHLFTLSAVLMLTACSQAESPKVATPKPATTSATAQTAAPDMSLEERGAKLYKRCRACHTLDDGGKNKVGPNLWAIYGRQAGVKEGYAYSKAMLAADIIWETKSMDAYLKRPSDYVPGGKMSFVGLKKQEDRDAVQAYLRDETTPK